jgi:hypothetical protein
MDVRDSASFETDDNGPVEVRVRTEEATEEEPPPKRELYTVQVLRLDEHFRQEDETRTLPPPKYDVRIRI